MEISQSMKILFLIFLIISLPISAQVNIILPDSFQVVINDNLVQLNQTWYDSLKNEVEQNKIHYEIAFRRSNKNSAETKLRIPQTFSFKQAIRQVIIYYSLLNRDFEREKEKVLIYPYFMDVDETEFVICNYSENTYYFHKKKWKTIPWHCMVFHYLLANTGDLYHHGLAF